MGFLHSIFRFRKSRFTGLLEAPIARYLASTQYAVMTGILFYIAYQNQDYTSIGGILMMSGLGLSLFKVLPMILSIFFPIQDDNEGGIGRFTPIFIGVVMAVVGQQIVNANDFQPLLLEEVKAIIILSPLASFLSFFWLSWQLKPFRLADRRNKSVPAQTRRLILVFEVMSAVPFGGIFIPLIIYLRDRYWKKITNIGHPSVESEH